MTQVSVERGFLLQARMPAPQPHTLRVQYIKGTSRPLSGPWILCYPSSTQHTPSLFPSSDSLTTTPCPCPPRTQHASPQACGLRSPIRTCRRKRKRMRCASSTASQTRTRKRRGSQRSRRSTECKKTTTSWIPRRFEVRAFSPPLMPRLIDMFIL